MSDIETEDGLPSAEPAVETGSEKVSSLDKLISSALDRQEQPELSADDEPNTNTDGRARDEHGRFVSKAAPADADMAATTATDQPEAQPAPEQPIEAPARWTEADKAAFAKLPREAQTLLSDRYKAMEADYTRKSQEVAEFRRHAEPLVQAVQPYSEYLNQIGQQVGRHPAEMIRNMIGFEYTLRTGTPEQKQQALAKLAADYGIAPALPSGEGGQQGQPDPYINHLYQRVPQLESKLSQFEQWMAQQEQSAVSQQVESFASARDANGNLKHPYFEDVKPHMAALMQSGQAQTMQEAYELATAPIRKFVETSEASRRQAEEKQRQDDLAKARRAAPVRTMGSAPRGNTQAKGLDALIAASMDKAGFG